MPVPRPRAPAASPPATAARGWDETAGAASAFARRGAGAAAVCGVYALLIGVLVPAALIEQYAVNVPIWDEWVSPHFWAAYHAGTLTWRDVVAVHNDHRIATTRLIMLGLHALLGQWNLVAEMTTSAVLLGMAIGVLGYTLRRIGVAAPTVLLLSVLLSSPVQGWNFLMGFQLQMFTLLLGVVVALCAVVLDRRLRWRTVVIAALGCLFSTFSFSAGLLSWAAVGGAMLVRVWLPDGSLRARLDPRWLSRLAAFAGAAAASAFGFLHGYRVHSGTVEFGARSVHDVLAYVTKLLVYPLLREWSAERLALALLQLACVAAATVLYVRRRRDPGAADRLVLFTGLGLFLVCAAFATAYGRAAAPVVPSRYATVFLLTVVLVLVAAGDLLRAGRARGGRAGVTALGVAGVVVALLVVHAAAGLAGLDEMRHQLGRATARRAIVHFLRDHSPGLPFQGFPLFPGDAGRQVFAQPELSSTLPPDMVPPWSALPVTISGTAWCHGCAWEGTAGRAPGEHWGSWRHAGPQATGVIRVGPVMIREPLLAIPLAGQPTGGNALYIVDAADPTRWIAFAGEPPGGAWRTWWADVATFVGREVVLVGIDETRDGTGWFAFGPPRPASRALRLFERALGGAGAALLLVVCTGLGLAAVLAPAAARHDGERVRFVAAATALVLGLGVLLGARSLLRAAPEQVASDAIATTRQPVDLLAHVPPHCLDGTRIARLPDGLYMHPDATCRLGPFRVGAGMCVVTRAGFRSGFPNRPGIDGVRFEVAIAAGERIARHATALRVHEARDLAVPVPAGEAFFVVLGTRQRTNPVWDHAIWHRPRLAPCQVPLSQRRQVPSPGGRGSG